MPSGTQHSDESLLIAQGLGWTTADGRRLFADLSFGMGRERVGLVGRNGIGKTTLVRILAGAQAATEGSAVCSAKVAYLPQDPTPQSGQTVAKALGVAARLSALDAIACGEGREQDFESLDDDWEIGDRIEQQLGRLGLGHLNLAWSVDRLSGGEITRLRLAALMLQGPDLLILDEPTNNLDRTARVALLDVLGNWTGGAIIITHDRELLGLVDRILELSSLGLRVYGGNFEHYMQVRRRERAAADHDLEQVMRELRNLKRKTQ